MGLYDDYTPSQAYSENVAQPDQRAWAKEAEARRLDAVKIEQLVGKETGKVVGYRCVHADNAPRIRTAQAIVVGLDSGLQVLVDVCAACMRKIKQARNG